MRASCRHEFIRAQFNSARRCKDNMETAVKTKKRVLLIDDDYYICNTISQMLEKENMLVDYENNASDGVKKAIAERYEAIIVDVHLPGMDGVSLFRILKEITPNSKVILTSGDALIDVMNFYNNVYIENFIQKPINKEELLKIITEEVKQI
jgi:DNA-binding NtrC family response regulator